MGREEWKVDLTPIIWILARQVQVNIEKLKEKGVLKILRKTPLFLMWLFFFPFFNMNSLSSTLGI